MRRRDWAGTVLVACLIAAAGLLRNHTVLLVLLAVVAAGCAIVIACDVFGKQEPAKGERLRAGSIRAGHDIRAGGNIEAGADIEAGGNIQASAEPLTLFESWLLERIGAAATIARQRSVRGDRWYFRNMAEWDKKNAFELMLKWASELVDSYREDVRKPGQLDGVGPSHDIKEHERYYAQRLAWLERTFKGLRDGVAEPSSEAR